MSDKGWEIILTTTDWLLIDAKIPGPPMVNLEEFRLGLKAAFSRCCRLSHPYDSNPYFAMSPEELGSESALAGEMTPEQVEQLDFQLFSSGQADRVMSLTQPLRASQSQPPHQGLTSEQIAETREWIMEGTKPSWVTPIEDTVTGESSRRSPTKRFLSWRRKPKDKRAGQKPPRSPRIQDCGNCGKECSLSATMCPYCAKPL